MKYKELIKKIPEVKTERDALLYLVRDNKTEKHPDNKTVDAVIDLIEAHLGCYQICHKNNVFHCFKKTKSHTKYQKLYSGAEETIHHCSKCGGPNNWSREELVETAREEGII